jgi:hypothetical protein
MVWARKPRTYNIWYMGAQLAGAARELQSGQKKAPNALKSLDAELKSAPAFYPPTNVRVAIAQTILPSHKA